MSFVGKVSGISKARRESCAFWSCRRGFGSLSEGAVAQRLRESTVLSPGADRGDSFRHGGKPPCHLPQGGRQCTGAAFRDLRERASRPFGPLTPGPFMGLKGAMECGKRASLFSAPLPKGGQGTGAIVGVITETLVFPCRGRPPGVPCRLSYHDTGRRGRRPLRSQPGFAR